MTAALSGQELAAILGTVGTLVLGMFGLLVKFAADARTEARSAKTLAADVNRAVNNRPEGEPTLYELVRETKASVESQGVQLAVISYRVSQLEQKAN